MHSVVDDSFETLREDRLQLGYALRRNVRRPAAQCVFCNFPPTSLLSCG
jgi:hypothetical protein